MLRFCSLRKVDTPDCAILYALIHEIIENLLNFTETDDDLRFYRFFVLVYKIGEIGDIFNFEREILKLENVLHFPSHVLLCEHEVTTT